MILKKTYNRDQFIDFITEFLPGINIDEREIKIADTKSSDIESAHLLGESKDLDLKVFEIKHTGTSKRRVGLTMEGFQIMRSSGAFRALIAFYSQADEQWRFSLMTLTPKRNEKAKLTIERSSPKRYSFVLGPNSKTATPEKFLISKGAVSDFEDLQSRFSLEVVNKDFYKKISELFTKLVGGTIGNGKGKTEYEPLLKLPSIQDKSQTSLEFAVRLIGRVIFCWFLREKKSKDEISLMPQSLLSHEAVKANENYYHCVLEPIFFEVLNRPIKERKDKFTQNGFNSIPYLNGGLFTPHYDDFFHYNEGKQAIFNNTVKIPDTWLQEFFEFLETYNFTIDENISFDEELSIDPEMLGRIFENLLAEINPETGESARKSTGSYYTPRTIVDYMVDESLYAYLDNKTSIDEEKIRAVISYDLGDDAEYPLTEEEQKNITEALHHIKILDPACGSGAFPMGMLQKIVFILQQTDPDGKNWFKKQILHASPEIRRAIEREFENKNFDYIRKLGIIRENIFGVDIQPIATEISRLRCFLTLIVDESIDDNAENRGIEPLPNLDFKFVTANTLIGLPQSAQSQKQANLFEDDAGIAELQELRDMFFNSTGAERDKLKFEFVQVQKRMLDHLIQSEIRGHAELTSRLTTWDPFSHQASSWFDPEWMFGIKEGFDVVIGNPPYNAKLSTDEKKFYKGSFVSVSKGRQDTAAIFVELGLRILKEKGELAYILPYRLFSRKRNHGQFQTFILNNSAIAQVLYLGCDVGFSANDEFMIVLLSNTQEMTEVKIAHKPNLKNLQSISFKKIKQKEFIEKNEINLNLLRFDRTILDNIEKGTSPLGKICHVKDGIVPFLRDKLISKQKLDERYVKFAGIAGTYKLKKYFFNGDELYLCYDLNEAKKYIKDTAELRKVQLRDKSIFTKRKIITAQNSKFLKGTIDEDSYFVSNSIHSTYLKEEYSDKYDLEYILGILNSKVINYYHNSLRLKGVDLHPQILVTNLKKVPIKMVDTVDKTLVNTLVNLVKKVIAQKKVSKDIDTSKLEHEIEDVVYSIYDLTPDEIKIIEDSFEK